MNQQVSTHYRASPWRGESEVTMPAIEGDPVTSRRLRLTTSKVEGRGLVSTAQVVEVEEGMVRFAIFGDYRAIVRTVHLKATEKNIRAEHQIALEAIPALIKAACEFYAERVKQRGPAALPAPV